MLFIADDDEKCTHENLELLEKWRGRGMLFEKKQRRGQISGRVAKNLARDDLRKIDVTRTLRALRVSLDAVRRPPTLNMTAASRARNLSVIARFPCINSLAVSDH